MDHKPLGAEFYKKPTLDVARNLLGKVLVKESPKGRASGIIVETEAYKGPEDRAAHSFGGRRTKRTEVMFGPAGFVYTYVMHTHCLVNVVCGEVGVPQAVLIRAVEPLEGEALMFQRRGDRKRHELTSGPGKLTKALGITKGDYGLRFDEPPLYIAHGEREVSNEHVVAGPRIGIENTGEARDYPWRFWIEGNEFVSKPRKVQGARS